MLESIKKLRTCARNMAKGRNLEKHEDCNLLLIIADEIEAKIAECYMELPVDADGVPIRFGDSVCEVDDSVPMKVMSFTYYEDCVDVNACGMNPNLLRHVKPRTVEDVLRDCCKEWNRHCGDDWEQGVYAKYAAELRMRDGDDR